ncbi:GNAT family N-acetyltransferase [Streptomyces canus]|uniref:GNAT family N-acetyltransferase n=1 Tax=Streptomyces canus TaxID=58343 RepID=UPI0030E5C2C0
MSSGEIAIRGICETEIERFLRVLGEAYGRNITDAYIEAWRGSFDYRRNLALFLGGRLVGTATAGAVTVTVPGPRQVRAVVTGNLTVDRRAEVPGLGRELFRAQCRRHREEGEPFLVFSVTGREMDMLHRAIGSAPMTDSMVIRAVLRQPETTGPGRSSPAVAVEELDLLSPELDNVHERVAPTTPGMIVRDRSWMRTYRTLSAAADPVPSVWAHRGPDGLFDGYALWSVTGRGEGRRVTVEEFTTATPGAWNEIIGELANITTHLEMRNCRTDDAALWWLSRRGQITHRELRHALWIRIINVPAALRARRYFATGRIRLEVVDSFLPQAAGRFLFETRDGHAECGPTTGAADVRLTIGALGALYLGHTDPRALALAGLIESEDDAAVARLGRLMAGPHVPWSGSER